MGGTEYTEVISWAPEDFGQDDNNEQTVEDLPDVQVDDDVVTIFI